MIIKPVTTVDNWISTHWGTQRASGEHAPQGYSNQEERKLAMYPPTPISGQLRANSRGINFLELLAM